MIEGSLVLEPFARVGTGGPKQLRMWGVRSAAVSQRRLCVQRRHRSPLVFRCGSDLPMGLPWEGTRRAQVPRSRRARRLASTEVTVWTVPGAEVPGFGSAVTHRLQWQPADTLRALPGAGWRDRVVSYVFISGDVERSTGGLGNRSRAACVVRKDGGERRQSRLGRGISAPSVRWRPGLTIRVAAVQGVAA